MDCGVSLPANPTIKAVTTVINTPVTPPIIKETVWGLAASPYALAHFRGLRRSRGSRPPSSKPLGSHIGALGLGTLAEIFDGDPPHTPRGCIAQAWTVGEILRAWSEIGKISLNHFW